MLNGKCRACQATGDKNSKCQCAIAQISAKDPRVFVSEKLENCPGTRAMARINDIVSARHQLIEIAGKVDRTGVLPDSCQVSSGLPIKQAKFLQFAVAERVHALAAARHQRLQLLPVWFALLNPACGDQPCSPSTGSI